MQTIQKTILLVLLLGMLGMIYSFCGFFVAKADSKLFNKASSVVLVRDGDRTSITMSNDFQGEVAEFAMVVPVPVVLKREDIDIADEELFRQLDNYSAPRLAEYYDEAPCGGGYLEDKEVMLESMVEVVSKPTSAKMKNKKESVKIEARYEVGEYDILILSAKESDGLQRWLLDNGYKIPSKAKEVLQPYITSKMKFFVVKVNMDKFKATGFTNLRPLRISFDSPKFMLPIRLGMANAKDNQDLIVYALTRKGRIETTNYQNKEMPSNKDVPLEVRSRFGEFYKAVFDKTWAAQKNVAYLEYAWDLSSTNPVKCDPCVGNPPMPYHYQQAGVNWVKVQNDGSYNGQVFITRMHFRYDRLNFPQDLVFQETGNREHFQCRYVIHHPANIYEPCDELHNYYKTVYERRNQEVKNLVAMSGWSAKDYAGYKADYKELMNKEANRMEQEGKGNMIKKSSIGLFEASDFEGFPTKLLVLLGLGLILGIAYRVSLREE